MIESKEDRLRRQCTEEYWNRAEAPYGVDKQGRIVWPLYPKEGDVFTCINPMTGCTWNHYVYFMGTWQFWKND